MGKNFHVFTVAVGVKDMTIPHNLYTYVKLVHMCYGHEHMGIEVGGEDCASNTRHRGLPNLARVAGQNT